MSGSCFGDMFKVSTWGESHGKAIGVVIDGCPAGLILNEELIQVDLDRRKPGNREYATKRSESDTVEILSGVFEGKTTGTPISLMIKNEDQHSKDYGDIKTSYRPAHADFTYDMKYGFRDYRGGGRSSGRETAARVAAGAVAKLILKEIGISFQTYTYSIGEIEINENNFDENFILNNPLFLPDKDAYEKARIYLDDCIKNEDSSGGSVMCRIKNVPSGIGEPVFDKLDAKIGQSIFSIGAVKALEFGLGVNSSKVRGSYNNDSILGVSNNRIVKETNNAGGILGGMSDGDEIYFRTYFKPTPSISQTQKTIDSDFNKRDINIKGRHDPLVVPRAVIVVECMTAITIVDLLLKNMVSQISFVKNHYK